MLLSPRKNGLTSLFNPSLGILTRSSDLGGHPRESILNQQTVFRNEQKVTFGAEIITKIIRKFRNSVSVIEINSKNPKFCICIRK